MEKCEGFTFKESKTQVSVKWDYKGNCPDLLGKILKRELFQNRPDKTSNSGDLTGMNVCLSRWPVSLR